MSKTLLLLALAIFATSCEGIKNLVVTNNLDTEVRVIYRSHSNSYANTLMGMNGTSIDSSVFVLPPDSSIQILSVFGGMIFNVKIREQDMPIDYLRLETPQTTIVAKTKKEIIELIYKACNYQLKVHGQNLVTVKIEF